MLRINLPECDNVIWQKGKTAPVEAAFIFMAALDEGKRSHSRRNLNI
jgi:hypothetical protein